MKIITIKPTFHVLTLLLIINCGGGSDSSGTGSVNRGGGSGTTTWTAGIFPSSHIYKSRCETPRTGTNSETGSAWSDMQGTALHEKQWLRSWSNELYLWYDEIIDRNPALYAVPEYFDLLKTDAVLPSGRPKDNFHFTYETEVWRQVSQSGIVFGYGLAWAVLSPTVPREIRVAYTEPNTPATNAPANLARGATLLEIDGIDVVNTINPTEINAINAALNPTEEGESHSFTFLDLDSDSPRTFTMQSGSFVSSPVQKVQTVATANGNVGYMLFKDHIATAEEQLVDGVEQLVAEGITDLVLDMRYNGGGFLAIASQLAYMIAGNARTQGEIFEQLQFSDKYPDTNPITGQPLTATPFYSETLGFSATEGQPLPTLNLNRVFVLTGPRTCSASESLINSLRGVDVEVIQIGSTTCGKPYGFYPADNCGTTYFSIQFTGANAKGFGEFSDGFSPENTTGIVGTTLPGCSVADDYTHDFGDPDEARFAAALAYRETETCPAPAAIMTNNLEKTSASAAATEVYIRPEPGLQNKIMGR